MSVLAPHDIDRLEEEYKRAVKLGLESFMFRNYMGDDYELDCSYVRYLLEYWKGEGDGKPYIPETNKGGEDGQVQEGDE